MSKYINANVNMYEFWKHTCTVSCTWISLSLFHSHCLSVSVCPCSSLLLFLLLWSFRAENRIEWSDAIKSAYMFYRCTHYTQCMIITITITVIVISNSNSKAVGSIFRIYTYSHRLYAAWAKKSNVKIFNRSLSLSQLTHSSTHPLSHTYIRTYVHIEFKDYICYNRLCALMFI